MQCLPRGEKMDLIIQKATELGVTRIVPVISQRSVVRLDDDQAQAKQKHWQAVAISACEQCGRARLPTVERPMQLLSYLGKLTAATHPRWVLQPHTAASKPERSAFSAADIAIVPKADSPRMNSTRSTSAAFLRSDWARAYCAPKQPR